MSNKKYNGLCQRTAMNGSNHCLDDRICANLRWFASFTQMWQGRRGEASNDWQTVLGKEHTRGTWKCYIIGSELICSALGLATNYKVVIVPVYACEWDQMFVYCRHTVNSFLHMCNRTRTASSGPYTVLCYVKKDNSTHFNMSYKILNSFFVTLSWKFHSFFRFDVLTGQILIF